MIEGANIAANHYTELAKRDDTRASRTRLSYSGMLLSSLGVFVAAGPGALQRSGFVSAIVPIRLTTQQFFIVSLSPVLASYLSRLFDVWMGAWIARTHKYAQWAALWKGRWLSLASQDCCPANRCVMPRLMHSMFHRSALSFAILGCHFRHRLKVF